MENITIITQQLAFSIDTFFLLITAMNILMMQIGFLALEAGISRTKSQKTLLYKNFVDLGIACLSYFSIGWGLFRGNNPFAAGEGATFYIHPTTEDAILFQQFSFAVVVATIVSSSVNPRMRIEACVLLSALLTSCAYPIVAHWGWNPFGWLAQLGFLDFAGGGIVHLFGGSCSIVVLIACGPRAGRFKNNAVQPSSYEIKDLGKKKRRCCRSPLYEVRLLPGASNPALMVVGTLLLWFGWFSFNSGSSLSIVRFPDATARAAINTLLSSSSSIVVAMFFTVVRRRKYDLEDACNSVLSGMVAITGSSGYVDHWAAIVIGAISFFVYKLSVFCITRVLGVDDPLQAVSVHGANGLIGLLWLGLTHPTLGLFYGGGLHLLGVEALGCLCISSFGLLAASIVVIPLRFAKYLTYSPEEQLVGIDFLHFVGEGTDVDLETEGSNYHEGRLIGPEVSTHSEGLFASSSFDAADPEQGEVRHSRRLVSIVDNRPTFMDEEMKRVMFDDRRMRKRFRAFLSVMHREEGVDFWDSVLHWKTSIRSNSKKVAESKHILNTFCFDSGSKQVNLSSQTLEQLRYASMDDHRLLDDSLFDRAISEVFGDLKLSFSEFVDKTPQYWL